MTVEPRVEELLASIRKAIDDDLGGIAASPATKTSGNSQGTLMRGALREMRVNFDPSAAGREQADGEISQLRERIGRSRSDSAFVMSPPSPKPHVPRASLSPEPVRRNGIGSILSGEVSRPELPPRQPPVLRQTYVEEAPRYVEPAVYEPEYQERSWEEQAEPQHQINLLPEGAVFTEQHQFEFFRSHQIAGNSRGHAQLEQQMNQDEARVHAA